MNVRICFSLREKLSAEPTDEGLMFAIEHGKLELHSVDGRTSSPCSAETLSFKEKDISNSIVDFCGPRAVKTIV